MPDSSQLLNEINATGSTHDVVRRRYLKELHEQTGRNVIIYYSGWLQKSNPNGTAINDLDKNGFMTVLHQLDRSKGLDLVLHTPGGEAGATESLVDYLRAECGTDIRAFVPQLAMSAGTMIACACKEIFMGKYSSLGPIDPQLNGMPAHGVLEEFQRAYDEIRQNQAKILVWQPILTKYQPAFIAQCEKAIEWTKEMVTEWLRTGMFEHLEEGAAAKKSEEIVGKLTDYALLKSHERHLSFERCKDMGLEIRGLEEDPDLQDAVLSVHHACLHTLGATQALKIIENHDGKAYIQLAPR